MSSGIRGYSVFVSTTRLGLGSIKSGFVSALLCMGRYLCLEPVLPVAMRFHASRSAVTSALASPMHAPAHANTHTVDIICFTQNFEQLLTKNLW